MIKSTVYNILAWIVLVLGLILGFIAGSFADSVTASIELDSSSGSAYILAMITTWVVFFVIALVLFFLAASLYHLEEIDNNTEKLLKLSETNNATKIHSFTNRINKTPPTPVSIAAANDPDNELKFRCMLCGKKHDGKDDVNVCPNCKRLL